jgi:NAD(P)-dependent dehydrogenase (short-subunit alcohol dehydrogenase family)
MEGNMYRNCSRWRGIGPFLGFYFVSEQCNLESDCCHILTVSHELKVVESFLEIFKMRFGASLKDWDDVMDINVKTVFFFSQAAAKQYIKQETGGKIINIASMLSFQGGVRVPSYTASKSGVMGITRLMANEWAKHNINTNAIAPGYMATNNTAALRRLYNSS